MSNKMTPEQKIKWAILLKAAEFEDMKPPEVTPENVDALHDALHERDAHWDATSEVRCGFEFETKLPCGSSRHYECKAVASKMPDGSYVGWDFWYGGGKHGEPDQVDWMDSAYEVNVAEEEKMVVVRTFSKAQPI